MKRHPFRTAAFLLALTFLSACDTSVATTTEQAPPTGVHSAPQRGPVILAPRDGATLMPPGPPGSGKVVKVALLLPLTGRHAELGHAMQDAATVALFDKYATLSQKQAMTRVELLPKDTGDTPEQARGAMRAALDEGAKLIIGPLFGDSTKATAPLALEKHISVISLSNNAEAAAPGVYAFGFSPQEQAERVVSYAVRNGKRVAALVPDDALGAMVLEAARHAAEKNGVTLAGEATYAPQGVGMEAALAKLITPGTPPNFDALLLPEGGPALSTILRALSTRGVTPQNVQLLGTGLWDDANLIRKVNLEGAWLASSPPQSTALFEQRFAATYNYVAPRRASLAYDAVSLATTLATSGHDFSDKTLTRNSGYVGPANGLYRLHRDGTVERALAVMKIEGSIFTVIDSPPDAFMSPAAKP